MVQVSSEELRTLAGALGKVDPGPLTSLGKGILPLELLGGMQEAEDPNRFIKAWVGPMASFATDLLSGIEVFETVAGKAAEGWTDSDGKNGMLLRSLMGSEGGGKNSVPENLSLLPDTREVEGSKPVEFDIRQAQEDSIFGNIDPVTGYPISL